MAGIGSRSIDGDKLLERLGLKGDGVLAKWLRRQPRSPKLVSSQGAAKILGVHPPHLQRLKDKGRLPEPVTIEGSRWSAYVKADIQALAKELKAERAAKKTKGESS